MPTQDLACFATVEDLEERTGKTYEGTELTRARSLLLDASVDLVGFGFDPDETDAYRLHIAKQCVCNAVSFKLDRDAASEARTRTWMVGSQLFSDVLATDGTAAAKNDNGGGDNITAVVIISQ